MLGEALDRLARLARGAAQPNVPGPRWKLGYTRRLWALLLPVAILSGLAGAGLRLLLRFVEHQDWSYRAGEMSNAVGASGDGHRIVSLAIAGGLAGGIWWAMQRLTGSTGGELNDALWSGEGEMPPVRTLISAALSTTIIALGASIGREQPPKDAAAAIAGWFARRGALSAQERVLLMACAAGGAWAAVYDMPLGGGVFTAEVLLGTLALPVLVPAVATAGLATAVSWSVLSVHPYYTGIPIYGVSTSLLVWGLLAGPLLGLGAIGFVWLLGAANVHRVRGNWVLLGPPVAFLVLGLAAIPFPQLLGNGRDIGENLFLGGLGTATIGALLVLKPLLTAACWGSGAKGGMFTPTTSYGALLGAILGRLWSLLWPGGPFGAFALIGAAGTLAAGMSAPVSAVVLMFELTGGALSTLMVPVLLAVAGATLTARLLGGGSVYSVRLPLSKPPERWLASGIWVGPNARGRLLPGFARTSADAEPPVSE